MNSSIYKHIGAGFVIMLFFTLTTPAQDQKFNVGFFGGINVSQISGDPYSGFNKLGFNAGLYVNHPIDNHICWQVEIKYGTRGVYEGPTDNNQTLYKSGFHIIELPLSVNYLFDNKILLELGTSPEVLVTILFWDEGGRIDRSNYNYEYRRFGLSVFAGIGYQINDRIMAGLRYTNSAVPIRDPEEWNDPQINPGDFHNVISFTLGYKINKP